MCGIVGVANLFEAQPVPEDLLLRMLASIGHRGPDGFGIYQHDWVGMGSARLSIIDLSGGDQPIGNEDDSTWVVFNGEIFNYVELRPELERRGHHFRTKSDTEVIVHMYEDLGPDCLNQFNGQFAIALWDERKQSLLLARDRIGIRPLFYALVGNQLVFGSEIKALLQHPGLKAEIDPSALRETFTYWSPQQPRSIFKGIHELPPGHFLLLQDGKFSIQAFWNLDFKPEQPARPAKQYLEELENLLIDATRIRLRADVPVGAYLSGGLDSSLTTALIRAYTPNRLDTFSISFSDPVFDESKYQKEMAEYLGTDHHIVHCDYESIGLALPDVIWHTETPILRTAPIPLFLLSGLVRENKFKVVMTGEGADEFLAGYDIFKEMKVRRFWAKDPDSELRSRLLFKLYPDINRMTSSGAFLVGFFKRGLMETASPYYSHLTRWTNTSRTWRFLAQDSDGAGVTPALTLPKDFASWPALSQAQFIEISTFLSPYLLSSQGDRMAMAHSVEGRYPFLDYRVMEFCGRLPAEMKMPVLTEKWILKQLGRKYLPDQIWQRLKRPYRAPIHRSFFSPKPLDYVEELLSEKAIETAGLFDPRAVQMLAQKARTSSAMSEVEDMALVGILSAQLVDQQFVRRAITHTPPETAGITKKITRTVIPS
jgi:asparagine synthase (glutamine-hydrolysing)